MTEKEWNEQVVDAGAPFRPVIDRKIRFEAGDMCRKGIAFLNESDVEDIVQELWIAVAGSWEKYNPDRSGISTFCYQQIWSKRSQIIRGRCAKVRMDGFKTIPILPDSEEAEAAGGIPEHVIPGEEPGLADQYGREELMAFAESRPEPMRTALLKFMNGEIGSLSAMAAECGMTVSSFRRKALKSLRFDFRKNFG